MPALLALGLSLAPQIAEWLFGSKGERVAQAATDIIRTVTGTDDAEEAQRVLLEAPEKAAEVKLKLAELAAQEAAAQRAADLEALKATLADTQDARAAMVALAKDHSPLAYGAAVVTAIMLALFAYSLVAGADVPMDLRETLKVLTVSAVSYWVGSSRGSAVKDQRQPAR